MRVSHVKREIEFKGNKVPMWAGCIRDEAGIVIAQCLHAHRQKFGHHCGIAAESCPDIRLVKRAIELQRT